MQTAPSAIRLATWNLNHRVGRMPFRPQAAAAACALSAEVVVLTEYFPQQGHQQFLDGLAAGGLTQVILSRDTGVRANRVLVAARIPIEPEPLGLPTFDPQFPANILAVRLPGVGIRVLGLRIPWYGSKPGLMDCWEWLESMAALLRDVPVVIIGDLNVTPTSPPRLGGEPFRRILQGGWSRAQPTAGHSFFGHTGARSEIDHAMSTASCGLCDAEYVRHTGEFELAGSPTALSDHAALVVTLSRQ